VPVFKNHIDFMMRGMKAFLKVEAGVTRDRVVESAPGPDESKASRASGRDNAQPRQLKRAGRRAVMKGDAPGKIPAERVLVATVVENRPPFVHEAELLFRTLRRFGGDLSRARCVAHFVGFADPAAVERLANLGVSTEVVEPFDERYPHANKIRMLETAARDFDYLVALDTDIVVARDFSAHVMGASVALKPVDGERLTLKQWESLFARFGLALPLARYTTSNGMDETVPYFNSGVLVIPRDHVQPLAAAWGSFVRRLLDMGADVPEIADYRFFTDQFALALALAEARLPFRPLPLEMNFPTHRPTHPALEPDRLNPYLIHHHHRVSPAGEVLPCSYATVDAAIADVNRYLQEGESTSSEQAPQPTHYSNPDFDNRDFWEKRYVTDPARGSGVGSRGENLEYKRDLLRRMIEEFRPRSILDVGCGDIEVVKDLPFSGDYTGIDLSPTVVARNQMLRPEWSFIEGDFLDLSQRDHMSVDLVICFDVLIHQHDAEAYEAFVRALARATQRVALINGYGAPPRKFFSEICAYHEPITQTLSRLGGGTTEIVGTYRGTHIVQLIKKPKWGRFDIGTEQLEWALAQSPSPEVLQSLVELSRKHFGWFSRTVTRAFEGPWIIDQINQRGARRILDIGAGVSPVPIYLAERGAEVVTVDNAPVVRDPGTDPSKWNDWGYFDYACLQPNLSSRHEDILTVPLSRRSFDCIYSQSVIEHMPSSTRKQLWKKVDDLLANEGVLLVTVDLVPDSDRLWNYNRGEEVEAAEEHGHLSTLVEEVTQVGLRLTQRQVLRQLNNSRSDCAMLRFER